MKHGQPITMIQEFLRRIFRRQPTANKWVDAIDEIPDDPWVEVHQEFDENHDVHVAVSCGNDGRGSSYARSRAWCDAANRNLGGAGFYKPYRMSEAEALVGQPIKLAFRGKLAKPISQG